VTAAARSPSNSGDGAVSRYAIGDAGGDRQNLPQMRNAKTTASVASDAVLIICPGMLASRWLTLGDGLPREGGRSWFQAGMTDWPP